MWQAASCPRGDVVTEAWRSLSQGGRCHRVISLFTWPCKGAILFLPPPPPNAAADSSRTQLWVSSSIHIRVEIYRMVIGIGLGAPPLRFFWCHCFGPGMRGGTLFLRKGSVIYTLQFWTNIVLNIRLEKSLRLFLACPHFISPFKPFWPDELSSHEHVQIATQGSRCMLLI